MVETHPEAHTQQPSALPYQLEDAFFISKTGNDEDGEDALYIGPHFVAVIDGATSKTERRWGGKAGGSVAACLLRDAFHQLPFDATARQAVDLLTAAIRNLYEQEEAVEAVQADPVQRAIACFAAVSFWRKEVWLVGDCQCMLNHERILNEKGIDEITAHARSLFLEMEIAQGKTIEELSENDTGRAFILPLLKRQMLFQNNPATGQYWFPVIDGFAVPDEGIRILRLPDDIETIVLASDGYPYVKETLLESEQALHEVLRDDPLLFRNYKATKGMNKGQVSYDDRSYIKLRMGQKTA